MTATLPIDSPAVAHGIGLFETMLAVRGRPFEAEAHCDRLISSARALGFPAPSRSDLNRALSAAAERVAALEEAAVRCFWVAVREPLDDFGSWMIEATAGAIPPATIARRESGRVVTLEASFRRALPAFKTTSHAAAVVALREANGRGADEALFVDGEGHILEGATTNVFAVVGETLITPPIAAGLLPGITRAWVIRNAPRIGYRVEEGRLTREELLRGSFLTGSLTTIAPIRSLDGMGCASLDERFRELVRIFRDEAAMSEV
jgi:branched-subunit amino acid aminotransferase/4-amino-4-deoxychorismate lyase